MHSERFMAWARRFIGTRDFYHQVWVLVVPMIVQGTVTNIVNLADNLMVGAIGTLPMAAVTIVNQIIFVFYLCVFGGLSAVSIFSTQYAGAKDTVGIRHCFRAKLIIMVTMTLVALAIFVFFPKELIGCFLQGKSSIDEITSTMEMASAYFRVMLLGLMPFALANTYSGTLRELGETRWPMIASIVAILTNVILNYLLIFGKFGFPALGVTGAALGTVIARVFELLIIAVYTHCNRERFPFIVNAYRSMYVPLKLTKDIVIRGLPLLFNELMWASGVAMLLRCYSLRGLQVVAACNISMVVSNIFNCAMFSVGHAVGVLVGHDLGANHLEKAKDTAWKMLALTIVCGTFMAMLTTILSPFLPLMFDVEEEVRSIATWLLIVNASAVPIKAICHPAYFAIRAGGRSYITFMLDSGFSWFVVIPITWYIGRFTEINIVPFNFISCWTECLKAAICIYLLRSGIWVRNIVGK